MWWPGEERKAIDGMEYSISVKLKEKKGIPVACDAYTFVIFVSCCWV